MDKGRSRKVKLWGGMTAALLVAVAALGLPGAASASAASRGFLVHNLSHVALKLEAVKPVPTGLCANTSHCIKPHYPMDFERRPADGSFIDPSGWDWFELKYGFSPLGGIQYAADLRYEIEGTNATVEYKIFVWSTSNTSDCKVYGSTTYSCSATDTRLKFMD